MKIAAGWLRADAGAVHLGDRVLLRPTLGQLSRLGVFFLPDHDLLSRSMALGAQFRLFEKRFGNRTAIEGARLARVEGLLEQKPHQLSGGELRRAELAAVLTRRPLCLLADEPYRGIAPLDHDALSDIFRTLAAEGCAVVITGHEVPSLLDVANHVTWCVAGTTHELGDPAIARRNEAFQMDYLGPTEAAAGMGGRGPRQF
jgi:ABC-type lipopolysaccharide export system ATPase subunit